MNDLPLWRRLTYLRVFSQCLAFSSLCAVNVNKTEGGSELAFSHCERWILSLLPGSGWFPPIHIWGYSSSLRILLPAFNLGTWETEEDGSLWVLGQPGLLPCFKKRNEMKRNEKVDKIKQNTKTNQSNKLKTQEPHFLWLSRHHSLLLHLYSFFFKLLLFSYIHELTK